MSPVKSNFMGFCSVRVGDGEALTGRGVGSFFALLFIINIPAIKHILKKIIR
jgi:hypothetical protein